MSSENLCEEYLGFTVNPCGYRILVLCYEPPEKTKSGLIQLKSTLKQKQKDLGVGIVLAIGADAYYNKEQFPTGAHVKVGDWVKITGYEREPTIFDGAPDKLCFFLNDNRFNCTIPRKDVPKLIKSHLPLEEIEENMKKAGSLITEEDMLPDFYKVHGEV